MRVVVIRTPRFFWRNHSASPAYDAHLGRIQIKMLEAAIRCQAARIMIDKEVVIDPENAMITEYKEHAETFFEETCVGEYSERTDCSPMASGDLVLFKNFKVKGNSHRKSEHTWHGEYCCPHGWQSVNLDICTEIIGNLDRYYVDQDSQLYEKRFEKIENLYMDFSKQIEDEIFELTFEKLIYA